MFKIMETKNFLGELSKSNEIAKVKAEIQCYANNIGAILSFLNNFSMMPDGKNFYIDAQVELDRFICEWSAKIDELVNAVRTTNQDNEQ